MTHGHKGVNVGQGGGAFVLTLDTVELMEDCRRQPFPGRLHPEVFQALAVGIDDHRGDVLAVGDLVIGPEAYFGQGVVADGACQGCRIEAQNTLPHFGPPARA